MNIKLFTRLGKLGYWL